MVLFGDLKAGDKIARRVVRLEGYEIVRGHHSAVTVNSTVTNACSGVRSVCVTSDTGYEYWMHDGQFSTIQDQLNRYDKL